jgi:hypothetical protein
MSASHRLPNDLTHMNILLTKHLALPTVRSVENESLDILAL